MTHERDWCLMRFMLKCDFHLHSLEDPYDVLQYNTQELIDHAARLQYQAIAFTFHRKLHCPPSLQAYAAARGILLIPGIEFFVEHHEVLLLGVCPEDLEHLETFDDLIALKKRRGTDILIVAPHPFYGLGKCLGDRLEEFPEAFDAVEFCHFYTRWWNPNHRAESVARRIGKPMIAFSDTHQLKWMKHHYCLVDAKADRSDIFAAVRAGRFQNITRPLSTMEIFQKTFWHLCVHDLRKAAVRWRLISHPAIRRSSSDGWKPGP
ncbi:MAG: PHP domain-containing protein [Verrucomicrobia bacterium]|nr:PHP domain-containing protein [Verrucomicrobiota bacterium]